MTNRMPSLLALLGLVAVAGYQNRDKIAEMLETARQKQQSPAEGESRLGTQSEGAFPLDGLGGSLMAGLGELVDRLKSSGLGQPADSWVSNGPNRPISPSDLETAIGEDTLAELSRKTGLSRSELMERLASTLPDAVDRLTPDGRLTNPV